MKKIKYLDGIKGLGAIGVFLSHYNMLKFPGPSFFHDSVIATWLMNGGYAVALFIILSGFSAWLSVQNKLHDNVSISKIIINRYFRFAIPLGIVFIILYITNYCGLFSYHILAGELLQSEPLKSAFWPVNIIGFTKSLILSPINPDFWDAPLWMMRYVFLSTYLALLLAMATKVIREKQKLIVISFTMIFITLYDIFFYGVFIGIILSYFYLKHMETDNKRKQNLNCHFLIGGTFLIACIVTKYRFSGSINFINFTSATFLLLSIYFLPLLQKVLESYPIQYLGKISFGIFIWHWPIMCSLTSYLFVWSSKMPKIHSILITFIPTLLCVIIVSHLSEKYIERKASCFINRKVFTFIYKGL